MKKLNVYVASSYNEKIKKCSYGVLLFDGYKPLDKFSNIIDENIVNKTYQVGGYLSGVINAIKYAINNNYDEVCIMYNFEGADKYTKIKEKDSLSQVVKQYIKDYEELETVINITFEKVNLNKYIPRTNLKMALDISRNMFLTSFDDYHLLNPKNYKGATKDA